MSAIDFLKLRQREVSCDDCLRCQETEEPPEVVEETPEMVNASLEAVPIVEIVETRDDEPPPTIMEDGTIVYVPSGDEPPPAPPGYKQGDDPWTFVRSEPFCSHLVLRQIMKESCGCVRVIPTCTYNGKSAVIMEETCKKCPHNTTIEKPTIDGDITMQEQQTHARPRLLNDGTIAYPKRGWEPPAIPAGYERKSNDLRSADAWIFIPIIKPCKHRQRHLTFSPCGNAKIVWVCGPTGRCVETTRCSTCEDRVE
jgi:hypothetical protein